MDAMARKASITAELQEKEIVNVNELAEELEVSAMTIRRDLTRLANEGTVKLFHGGAQLVKGSLYEFRIDSKIRMYAEEKKMIAAEAASMVQEGMTVFLDAGTTCAAIARQLMKKKGITVVTNSLMAANELAKTDSLKLVITPGEFRPSAMAFIGEMTNRFCENLTFDRMFISANGITPEHGISVMGVSDAATKRGLITRGSKVYAVLDSSKFGEEQFSRICGLDQLSGIITDCRLSEAEAEAYRRAGYHLIRAGRTEHK